MISLQVGECWLWSLIIFLIHMNIKYIVGYIIILPPYPDHSLEICRYEGRIYVRVFFPRRKPSFMKELYCGYVSLQILYSERGYCERKKRNLQRVCCMLYPFICWIIKKEGPDNFSSGCSPHWVNHIYLCIYCIVYLLYLIYAFVLFYCSTVLFF